MDERTDGMTPVVPDNRLVGRIGIDLASQNSNTIQIPKDAQGLAVVLQPDNQGALSATFRIYEGEQGGFPWAVIIPAAGGPAIVIATGPLTQMAERGAYLTIVQQNVSPVGHVIFEFYSAPLNRTYGRF